MTFGGNKLNYFSKNQLALALLHGSSNSCFLDLSREKISQHFGGGRGLNLLTPPTHT